MLRFKSLSPLILVVLLSSGAFAQLQVPPGFGWRTMETEHFLIHYPQAQAELAGIVAVKAESLHPMVTSVLMHTPREKTNIVIHDYYDVVFGAALPEFFNAIYISPTPCAVGLSHYEDFLDLVLLHEYCHIVDMDMIGGAAGTARTLFGRLYSPNAFCPIWMIEGFATYMETELTNGGRGVDPFYDMYLRMAFLEDEVTHLDQNTLFLNRWPGGVSPYLYGESLYRYMTGGEDTKKAVLFRKDNSRKLWPFSFGGGLSYYWNGSIANTYRRWEGDLLKRYQLQRDEIESRGITPTQRLTCQGYDTWGIEWSADDEEIFFFNSTYDEHAFLKSVNVQSKVTSKLAKVNCWSPQLSLDEMKGDLYFAQLEIHNRNALYSDIYFMETYPSPKVRKVTSKKRAFDPDVSRSGELIYLSNREGATDLWLRRKSGQEEILVKGTLEMHFSHPRFSPDGEKIALSVWRRGGLRDIWIYRIDEGSFSPITQDAAWDITPSWSPDGKLILFSSDRTGVYNVFAYRIEDGAFFQLTNVLGGAFYPQISHDQQQIAFVGYSSQGFDVYTTSMPTIERLSPVDMQENQTPHEDVFVYGYDSYPQVTVEDASLSLDSIPVIKSGNYNPLKTLLKPIRFPVFTVDDTGAVVGVFLFGMDVLSRHYYNFLITYSLEHQRPAFSMQYQNAQLYPIFLLSAEDFMSPRDLPKNSSYEDEDFYWERVQDYFLGVEVPFQRMDRMLSLGGGVGWTKYTPSREYPSHIQAPFFRGKLGYWFLGALYSDAHRYSRSISNEEGFTVVAGFRQHSQHLCGDLTFRLGQISVDKFFRVPGTKHHVFFTRLLGEATDLKGVNSGLDLLSRSPRGFKEIDWRKRMYGGSVEYRLPLLNIQRGFRTWPFFLRQIHCSLFTDYWRYFDRKEVKKELACSGIELALDLGLVYRFPLSMSLGYAQPWKGEEGMFNSKVYWRIELGVGMESKLHPSSDAGKALSGRKF